jgi:hypothetical protein
VPSELEGALPASVRNALRANHVQQELERVGDHGSGSATTNLNSGKVFWYINTMTSKSNDKDAGPLITVERVQTGVRLEKRLLKVLKGLAELKDLSLGDLLEGIVLHVLEGKAPFSAETLKEIAQLRTVYGLTLRAKDSHRLQDRAS